MPEVDFDAYWQAVADRREARKQAHREAMSCRKAAKSSGKKPSKKKRRRSKERGILEPKRGFVRPEYRQYINSREWAAKRKEAFQYHGRKCSTCGSEHNLEVHHLTYQRLGREKMEDLQILCGDCHRIRHEDKPGVVTTDYLSEQFRAIVA